MIKRETPKLVLASASQVRAAILGGAGIDFDICPSQVDEDLLKGKIKNGPDLALALAGEKARAVALEYPAHLVLGADQILSCNGKLFDKPRDMDEARENLIFMRGKTHQLINGMVLVLNGQPVWQNTASASLTMRDFSDDFLNCANREIMERLLVLIHYLALGLFRQRSNFRWIFDKLLMWFWH